MPNCVYTRLYHQSVSAVQVSLRNLSKHDNNLHIL